MEKMKRIIKDRLPAELQKVLQDVNADVKDMGYRAYLVGGVVRDVLLGNRIEDLDIVVEGDAVEAARIIGGKYGSAVKVHNRFKTATATIGQRWKADFITAREEIYAAPGALPDIRPSSLYNDLFRRDFTINTLAVSLDDYTLIDYFRGLEDIKDRKLRVLHDKSFIDDPTRIFRCLRFETQLRFEIETKTKSLLVEAIDAGFPLLLSIDRLSNEFERLFAANEFGRIFLRMHELGILEQLFDTEYSIDNVCELLKNAPVRGCERKTYIALTLFDSIDSKLLGLILHKYKKYYEQLSCLRRKRQDIWRNHGSEKLDFSELYELFKSVDMAVIKFLMTVEDEAFQKCAKEYCEKVVRFPMHISGEDLKALGFEPGPDLGEMLERAKKLILKNRIEGKDDQIEYLRSMVKGSGEQWDRA